MGVFVNGFVHLQEFRMQVQEMKDFIGDKKRLVREDSFRDGIGNIKVCTYIGQPSQKPGSPEMVSW